MHPASGDRPGSSAVLTGWLIWCRQAPGWATSLCRPGAAGCSPRRPADRPLNSLLVPVGKVVLVAITQAHGLELAEKCPGPGHHSPAGLCPLLQPGLAHHGAGRRSGSVLRDDGGESSQASRGLCRLCRWAAPLPPPCPWGSNRGYPAPRRLMTMPSGRHRAAASSKFAGGQPECRVWANLPGICLEQRQSQSGYVCRPAQMIARFGLCSLPAHR